MDKNWHEVFLGLGSNCENAEQMLAQARERVTALPQIEICAVSSIYETEPQGYAAQPWFLNQVVKLKAGGQWPPAALMVKLLAVEASLGRKRGPIRFGPRAIDIDILLYNNLISDNPVCILPHPRLAARAFALVPLSEIAPGRLIGHKTVEECLNALRWRMDGNKIFQ